MRRSAWLIGNSISQIRFDSCETPLFDVLMEAVLQNDSPPELPPDPIDDPNMPELQHQGSSSGLLSAPGSSSATAAGGGDNSVINLASSFKDKMKIEKKHGSSENQPKEVMVEVGGKKKPTGGKRNKKSVQTANMVGLLAEDFY